MRSNENICKTIITFLHSINIPVVEAALSDDTFLPGLSLKGNAILMDPAKMKYPGDLLHEAGHIAVTEAQLRPSIGTDEMVKDWPTQGDEIATILWSYAACCHLGMELDIVFHPHGYKNDSEWLIEQFTNKNYIGLPLLEWMSLCTNEDFPTMKKWVR